MEENAASASRPEPLHTQTTPIPTPSRSAHQNVSLHPSGPMSPPETPTRSDSVTSTHIKVPLDKSDASERNLKGSTFIKEGVYEFTAQEGDYEVLKGNKLGAGRFSQVYLARSVAAITEERLTQTLTPPGTPTSPKSRSSWSNRRPTVYAIKIAADKTSVNQLRGEARVLSYLARNPDCIQYIVPFHGLDTRITSLVFTALPASLDDLVNGELQQLNLVSRTAKLAAVLPHIARSLTAGLAWMHSLGVVHSDIKPPNILLRADISIAIPLPAGQSLLDVPFTPVFADFTSSFLTSDDPKMISAVGGGTYDYMSPEQLTAPFPLPNSKMDVYALGVSLLQIVTGCSPFRLAGPNRHMKMAMIKEGKPLAWATRDSMSEARIEAVAGAMLGSQSIDLKALLELGLRKNPNERLDAQQWNRLW